MENWRDSLRERLYVLKFTVSNALNLFFVVSEKICSWKLQECYSSVVLGPPDEECLEDETTTMIRELKLI